MLHHTRHHSWVYNRISILIILSCSPQDSSIKDSLAHNPLSSQTDLQNICNNATFGCPPPLRPAYWCLAQPRIWSVPMLMHRQLRRFFLKRYFTPQEHAVQEADHLHDKTGEAQSSLVMRSTFSKSACLQIGSKLCCRSCIQHWLIAVL